MLWTQKQKLERWGGGWRFSLYFIFRQRPHISSVCWVEFGMPIMRTRTQCFVIMMLPHKSFKFSRLDRFKERRYPNPYGTEMERQSTGDYWDFRKPQQKCKAIPEKTTNE